MKQESAKSIRCPRTHTHTNTLYLHKGRSKIGFWRCWYIKVKENGKQRRLVKNSTGFRVRTRSIPLSNLMFYQLVQPDAFQVEYLSALRVTSRSCLYKIPGCERHNHRSLFGLWVVSVHELVFPPFRRGTLHFHSGSGQCGINLVSHLIASCF